MAEHCWNSKNREEDIWKFLMLFGSETDIVPSNFQKLHICIHMYMVVKRRFFL
jgi:hypothetical protein